MNRITRLFLLYDAKICKGFKQLFMDNLKTIWHRFLNTRTHRIESEENDKKRRIKKEGG